MNALGKLACAALLCLGTARADEAVDFCRLRSEAVLDENRDEADERCNRVAAALVGSPGEAALAQLAELDAWLARHRRPPVAPQPSCDELVDARRRALFRTVDDRLTAEEHLLRELERTHRKSPAPSKRRRVHDLTDPF